MGDEDDGDDDDGAQGAIGALVNAPPASAASSPAFIEGVAPRGVVNPQPFTPPAEWQREYYEQMHRVGADTLAPSFAQRLAGKVAAVPYTQLHFFTADSIPAQLGQDYAGKQGSLTGLYDTPSHSITFVNHGPRSPMNAAGDSIQANVVQHEMAHAMLGSRVNHANPIFAKVLENPAYWGLRGNP